jgi:cob(I)alamin adenosyltransferase
VTKARSDDEPFAPPRLAINRVYTRKGDSGTTALAGGQRVRKDALRIEAYGTLDELNAVLGAARQSALEAAGVAPALGDLAATLLRVQHELFNAGSALATLAADVHPRQPRVTAADVAALEAEIDRSTAVLEPLRSFVLPGGSRLNADLHLGRTVCRRAERLCCKLAADEQGAVDPVVLAYLNRLSDALFVWSRLASRELGAPETLWDPNLASSRR